MTVTAAPERGAVDLVECTDAALAELPPREFVTLGEAQEILDRVLHLAEQTTHGPAVAAIVLDALESVRDHSVLDRSRLIDPLLDIRNLATSDAP